MMSVVKDQVSIQYMYWQFGNISQYRLAATNSGVSHASPIVIKYGLLQHLQNVFPYVNTYSWAC